MFCSLDVWWKSAERFLTAGMAAAILVAVGLFVYSNSFLNDMFWDDYDSIVNNQYVRSWEYFPKYFSENLTAGAGVGNNYWRPLLLFSFSVDYQIGGLTPFFYHFQNLFWHVLAAWLVFVLIVRLVGSRMASLVSALVFLTHPVQVEAVTYVAGRADPMYTALMLGALLLFMKFLDTRDRQWWTASVLFFAGALMTKERAIMFPVVLGAYVWIFERPTIARDARKWLGYLAPFLAVAAVYVWLRMTVLHFADTFDIGADDAVGLSGMWSRIILYLEAAAKYAQLLVWPSDLTMERMIAVPTSVMTAKALAGMAVIGASVWAWVSVWRRGYRASAFGIAWFIVAFLPSVWVLPIQGILYEHWLYPALPGLCLVLGEWLKVLHERKSELFPIVVAVLLVAILGFAVRTMTRNFDWQNPIRFYEKTVAMGGGSARVYTNLGMAYDDARRPDEAIAAYRKAIELDDSLFPPWYDVANTYRTVGRPDEAIAAYRKAIELNPDFLSAYINLSSLYFGEKDYGRAEDVLHEAQKRAPNDPQIWHNLEVIAQVLRSGR